MDEFSLIAAIKRTLGPSSPAVETGIGDDCAVVTPPRGRMLLTLDALVEGVHFDRAYAEPEDIGHKLLAVNASDIASMGGRPLYAVVSLLLSESVDEAWVERLYVGIKGLAQTLAVDVVGGNVARSPGVCSFEICLVGEVGSEALRRQGARPGDLIAVTGGLGESAAGLASLRRFGRNPDARFADLVRAHLRPTPRVRAGQWLAKSGKVTSAIDVSDGLTSELHHLAAASGVRMEIDVARLPVSRAAVEASRMLGADPIDWAFNGGEDYELLVTVDSTHADALVEALAGLGERLTVIGRVSSGEGVVAVAPDGTSKAIEARGWRHFRGSKRG